MEIRDPAIFALVECRVEENISKWKHDSRCIRYREVRVEFVFSTAIFYSKTLCRRIIFISRTFAVERPPEWRSLQTP